MIKLRIIFVMLSFLAFSLFSQLALCQEEPQPVAMRPEMITAVDIAYENSPAPNCVPNFEDTKLLGYICGDQMVSPVSN